MVVKQLTLGWGMQPPEGVAMAWGARAIWPRENIGFVSGRKSIEGGTEKERKALYAFLEGLQSPLDLGAIPELRNRLKASDCKVRSSNDEVITIERDGFTLEASARSSHGYIYIGAWPTPKASS